MKIRRFCSVCSELLDIKKQLPERKTTVAMVKLYQKQAEEQLTGLQQGGHGLWDGPGLLAYLCSGAKLHHNCDTSASHLPHRQLHPGAHTVPSEQRHGNPRRLKEQNPLPHFMN